VSATVTLVAHGHGRDSLLIDLDARNLELCRERLGPLTPIATTLGTEAVAR